MSIHYGLTLPMCQENDYLDKIGTIVEINRHKNTVHVELHQSGNVLVVPRFDEVLSALGLDQPRYRVFREQKKFRPMRGHSVLHPDRVVIDRNRLEGNEAIDQFVEKLLRK